MATAPLSPRIKVVWAQDLNGRSPAKAFFDALSDADQRKLQHSIDRLEGGDTRLSREQFKSLGEGLYEFKEHQARLIGGFQNGAFVLAHGLWKKKDDMPKQAMLVARRILKENEAVSGSTRLIKLSAPTPSPIFRPVLVPPPEARPLFPEPEPVARSIFKKIDAGQEYSWAYVKRSDILPPDAPLMQSLTRLPRIHTMLAEEQVEPYLRKRLAALPKDVRVAMGILSDDVIVGMKLAMIWGIEMVTALELEKQPEAPIEIEAPPIPMPEPEPEPTAEGEMPTFYWMYAHDARHGRKRWITEIVGYARKYGSGPAKVKIRAYHARSHKWTGITKKPASMFKDLVSMKDPLAQEALRAR